MKKNINIYNVGSFFQHSNSKNPVTNTVAMQDYYNKLDNSGKTRLGVFFHHISMSANVSISPITYKTETGIEYVYINIRYRSGGGLKFTLICFPGFETFRDILINNIVQIELVDLLKECETQNQDED